MKRLLSLRLINPLFAPRAQAMPGSSRSATVTMRQTLARQGQRLHWNAERRQVEIVPH